MNKDNSEIFGITNVKNSYDNISKPMKEAQDLIRNYVAQNIPKIDMPKMNIPKMNMPKISIPELPVFESQPLKIDTSMFREYQEEIAKQKEEELKREIENNESLKNIVIYNQQLVDYNQQLVNLNEGILRKINVIGSTMDNIIENIEEGSQHSREFDEEQTKLLLQLINIMESKNEKGKLGDFLKNLTGDVAAGLITGYLQYKLGLS